MSDESSKVVAVRGAVQADSNSSEAILAATGELLREVIGRNDLEPDAIISAIFTATEDLNADFPAVAARQMGLSEVPLMCAREIPVAGAMTRVIRLMLHFNAPADHKTVHVYLGEAARLREDLNAAQ